MTLLKGSLKGNNPHLPQTFIKARLSARTQCIKKCLLLCPLHAANWREV